MTRRVVVSTQCPNCGGPIAFDEGSSTVFCTYCRSELLITGRKQILTWSIAQRVTERVAINHALGSRVEHNREVLKASLHLVPYYRFVGDDFVWADRKVPERRPEADRFEAGLFGAGRSLGSSASINVGGFAAILSGLNDFANAFREPTAPLPPIVVKPRRRTAATTAFGSELEVRDRRIEKSFVACDLSPLPIYSLGMRPAALKMTIFRHDRAKNAVVVAPSFDAGEALRRALMADTSESVYRRVVGRVMSVVYFPYWLVDFADSTSALVDGVTGQVVERRVSAELRGRFDRRVTDVPAVASLRPLVCANCRGAVHPQPGDVVFFCRSCRRAWQISSNRLEPVRYKIVRPRTGSNHRYLPVWLVRGAAKDLPDARLLIPAFRYPKLSVLVDLAREMTNRLDSLEFHEPDAPMHGAWYDADDASLLAGFIHAASVVRSRADVQRLRELELNITERELLWMPFESRANFLRDPITSREIFANLL